MEYICKKCNNKTYGNVQFKDKHIGLYCTNCNSWIKWLSKAEYEEYKKEHNSSSQVKVDANNYDSDCTVPSSSIDTIYQIDNVPPLDVDSFAFYCYPMHRDCEFAKPSGDCRSIQCRYQDNSVSTPSDSLPDEITLNGIVYIKKSLIKEQR